jgi:hypothetical protein
MKQGIGHSMHEDGADRQRQEREVRKTKAKKGGMKEKERAKKRKDAQEPRLRERPL